MQRDESSWHASRVTRTGTHWAPRRDKRDQNSQLESFASDNGAERRSKREVKRARMESMQKKENRRQRRLSETPTTDQLRPNTVLRRLHWTDTHIPLFQAVNLVKISSTYPGQNTRGHAVAARFCIAQACLWSVRELEGLEPRLRSDERALRKPSCSASSLFPYAIHTVTHTIRLPSCSP